MGRNTLCCTESCGVTTPLHIKRILKSSAVCECLHHQPAGEQKARYCLLCALLSQLSGALLFVDFHASAPKRVLTNLQH